MDARSYNAVDSTMTHDAKNLRGTVAIAGVGESDELGRLPHKSSLQLHMEATANGEAPDFLTLTTLDELQLDPKERDKLLGTFGGGMLESYRKTGRNQYVIRARSRDKKHTLYELSPGSVQQIAE